jgi:CysZ protein
MVPVFFGILLFSLIGTWVYGDLLSELTVWVESNISIGEWGSILKWILVSILSVVFYFLLSWTFILIVSLFSSPFNELISSRVEKLARGQEQENISDSIKTMMARISFTIVNELKKVSLIGLLSVFAVLLNFSGFLAPVSLLISALLLASQFLDYSWARHDITFRGCLAEIKGDFLKYGVSGGIFLFAMSVPFINIFALPYAVIYFTLLRVRNQS